MHVAILGAGALGRVYGVRLATPPGRCDVSFVVRPERVTEREPFTIVRVDGDHATRTLAEPVRVAAIPAHADVVLVCVRVEQLAAATELAQARADVPIVLLTPLMPQQYEQLSRDLGPRVVAAMPGVVSYLTREGAARYWLPRVAPTLLDEPRPPIPAVTELVASLSAGGIPARIQLGVHEENPATTVAFIPLAMGLDAAGSIDALLGDRKLLDLALAATREGLALSKRIGKSAPWVGMLARFAGPRMIRIGVSLARRRSPEAVGYVEEHFGHKLHAQNVLMAGKMIELADAKGTPHEALSALHAELQRA